MNDESVFLNLGINLRWHLIAWGIEERSSCLDDCAASLGRLSQQIADSIVLYKVLDSFLASGVDFLSV